MLKTIRTPSYHCCVDFVARDYSFLKRLMYHANFGSGCGYFKNCPIRVAL